MTRVLQRTVLATLMLGAVASPPYAFLQATKDGERALAEAVRPALAGTDVWADLFCGMGTFALTLLFGRAGIAALGL